MKLFVTSASLFVILALGLSIAFAQERPTRLTRAVDLEQELYGVYPNLETRGRYFYDNLRPARAPSQAARWYAEMESCLQSEGIELREERVGFEGLHFYLYSEGWKLAGNSGYSLAGTWFGHSIAVHDKLEGDFLERILRHEMVHDMLGPTRHPYTTNIVGDCSPWLMLDSGDTNAGPANTGGALSGGLGRFLQ